MSQAVRGAQELALLGARLKAAGDASLRRELLRGIRKAGAPMIEEIRKSAGDTLPRRGGLADRVAAEKFAVRTRLSASGAAVRIQSMSKRRMDDLNRGRLRHPVFGNREVWVQQSVAPGFFDRPVEQSVPDVRREVEAVMKDVARKIEKG